MLLPPEIPELRFPAWSAGEGSRHPGSVGAFSNAAARWASRQPIKEKESAVNTISTLCVKIGYDNGVTVSIDCIAVEKRIPRNMYECSEPDCRICNDPPEYVKLVRSEAVDHNLHKYDDDSGLD